MGKLTEMNNVLNNVNIQDANTIDIGVEQFSKIINDVAEPLFHRQVTHKNKPTYSGNTAFRKSEWFDEECYTATREYLSAVQNYTLRRTEAK